MFESEYKNYSNQVIKDRLFSGQNLSCSNFSKSKLIRVDFTGSNLSNANFSNSKIYGCNFESSNLSESEFCGAYIGLDKIRFWLILFASIVIVILNVITGSASGDLSEIAPSKWIEIYKHISIYVASFLMILVVFLWSTYWFVLNYRNFFSLGIKDFNFWFIIVLYLGCISLLVYSLLQTVFLTYKVSKTSFLGANLTGADFEDTIIRDTDFSDATLIEVQWSGNRPTSAPN